MPASRLAVAAALAVAAPCLVQEPPPEVAFTNVNVVPMDRQLVLRD